MFLGKYKNIAEVLTEQGLLLKKDYVLIAKEAEMTGKSMEDIILAKKLVDEDGMVLARAKFLNLPYVDLREENIPISVLKLIPEEAITFYRFIPFSRNNDEIRIAMIDPEDIKALEALKFITLKNRLRPVIYLTSLSSFNESIRQFKAMRTEIEKVLETVKEEKKVEDFVGSKEDAAEKIVEETPVSKVVDIILRHALDGKASDIHIEPEEKEIRVRFRVDGVLHASLFLPKRLHLAIVSRVKILSNLKIDEQRRPQDGRFRAVIDGKAIDFRVSTLPTSGGEKVVMRVLDKSVGLQSLESLGLWGKDFETVNANLKKPYGMVLITGPTGSGKSTTLYALLNILNQEGTNIITLEDPVEYYIEGVNQSEVKPEIGYTFAAGLRSILRQDPNVIMVGEIRDRETAELATHAALTGHIVLSTLHTNDSVGVIPRLVDMGIEPFLVTSALNVVIAQRLVRRICDKCIEEYAAPRGISEMITMELDKIVDKDKKTLYKKEHGKDYYKLYRGKGCKYCGNKGTKGRVAVYEVLSMTKKLEDIVIKSPVDNVIRAEAVNQGMTTMKQDGVLKSLKGLTTIEEALRVTME